MSARELRRLELTLVHRDDGTITAEIVDDERPAQTARYATKQVGSGPNGFNEAAAAALAGALAVLDVRRDILLEHLDRLAEIEEPIVIELPDPPGEPAPQGEN